LFVWKLADERANYALLKADVFLQEEREKSSAELRTLVRDTRAEREALEQLSHTDVLAAAATIEAAGNVAGVEVTIGNATTARLTGSPSEDLQAVIVLANAEGTLQALLAAASLFESLPFPSLVESYELYEVTSKSKSTAGQWHMTARIRILTPSENGV
jgi:hypothetical protein